MKIKSVRGTQDILPGTVERWQQIESATRRIFRRYGYAEIRTPLLEETELFARSIGGDTDIVQKEMYTFHDSKGRNISLRPEGTASVVRAYLEHGLFQQGDVSRLYYLGPMFRHERPQKGRYRQFHQIGAEVLGSDHPAVEAEVIEMLLCVLEELGISSFQLLINSVGDAACRPAYVQVLQQAIQNNLERFCRDCQNRSHRNPLRVLDCKVPSCQPLIGSLPFIQDHLCRDCREHFERFRHYLDLYRIPYTISPRLVRGLDYYVRTTFEIISPALGPTQNAILGGGRYDGLTELLGGPPTKGFGFALGMERLMLLSGQQQAYRAPAPEIFLACLDEAALHEGLQLARELRAQEIFAYLDFEGRSLKAQLRLANRLHSCYLCVIGAEELRLWKFKVKRMEDGRQETVPREQLAEYLKSSLSSGPPEDPESRA